MGYDLKSEVEGSFVGTSKAWIAHQKGIDEARTITLDLSTFTGATHYPDGFLRSGLVVARKTAGANSGLYVPYVNAAADGQGVPAGHLLDDVRVRAGNTTGRSVAALFWSGIVLVSKLPTNHGLHATDRPTTIRYEA